MKKNMIVFCLLVLLLSVSACQKSEIKSGLKDGEYEGVALGFYDEDVVATVTIDKGKLTEVVIDTSNETPDIGEPVGKSLSTAILEKGTTEGVDKVAQATVSSTAALEAVNKALAKAK